MVVSRSVQTEVSPDNDREGAMAQAARTAASLTEDDAGRDPDVKDQDKTHLLTRINISLAVINRLFRKIGEEKPESIDKARAMINEFSEDDDLKEEIFKTGETYFGALVNKKFGKMDKDQLDTLISNIDGLKNNLIKIRNE